MILERLISPTAPEDALTNYYAFQHSRTTLRTFSRGGAVEGFLAICQTGQDLFTPLVVMRAFSDDGLGALMQEHLDARREYLFNVREDMAATLRQYLVIRDEAISRIHTVNQAGFRPVINVLVQRSSTANGHPRFEIRSGGEVGAVGAVAWQSDRFAEIGVSTIPTQRRRGWGKAVVSACTSVVLAAGLTPLYVVAEDNLPSIHIAETLGYRFTGKCEFSCRGRLRVV
ncbi:MAG: GNAT family N-acetyltransferase [Chloroflexota bacterium]|nr:GNAT family N-acetyltransferase [Chloroflexota bacterium]